MNLSPIVLFVYNRPEHTKMVLDALALNEFADKSILYIFSDGGDRNFDSANWNMIEATRKIINEESRFKHVQVFNSNDNLGLANSIINGLNYIFSIYDKVIVLEDDILPSTGFIKYMNEALNFYEKDNSVGCIHAWNYSLDYPFKYQETFLLKGADCWGWATWKRYWDLFEQDGLRLLSEILIGHKEFEFDRRGTHQYTQMLKDQIIGANNSWAIRWHASLFLNNLYCLQPKVAIVKNIGLDGSGIHCLTTDLEQNWVDKIDLQNIPPREDELFFRLFKNKYVRKKRTFKELVRSYYWKVKSINSAKEISTIWKGNYKNWNDAMSYTEGYSKNGILEKCKSALLLVKNGVKKYERDSVVFDHIEVSWGLLVSLKYVLNNSNNYLHVLDFGGSLGSTYYQNRNFLPENANVLWNIVEQNHFVTCGIEHFQDNTLKFYYNIEECIKHDRPNVLLLSSVIQYLENPFAYIEYFVNFGFEYILFDRTAFVNHNKSILTVQKVPDEIYSGSYPSWFLNETEFYETLLLKYDLVYSFNGEIELPILLDSGLNAYWKGGLLKLKSK